MTSKEMTNKSRLFLITGATGNIGARLTDQNGYRIVLQAIIDAPQSENQSQALDNAVAQEQAKKLLLRFEELIGTMGVCEDHDWHAGRNACRHKQFELRE